METWEIIDNARLSLTSWNHFQSLGDGYEHVEGVQIRWLQYTTSASGNTEMIIKIEELGNASTKYTGLSNSRAFISIPLDLQAFVTNTYANYTTILDKTYKVPFHVNQLSFQVTINGAPAFGITPSNPLEMNVVFLRRSKK